MTQSSAVHCYSVFIVEDETLLRLMISEMLEELGHHVSSEAGQIEQALPLAKTAEFDVALLDVNVAGRLITPVVEIVASRNRPMVFVTGYGRNGIPEPFRDRPTLRKPFMLEKLQQTIDHTMAGLRAAEAS
jgi:CheY-like chemotaxis protein